jgi:hypothetical protein
VTPRALSTAVNSQLDEKNLLYLAEIGGEGEINGTPINYAASTAPFVFDLVIDPNDPNSWTNGGAEPTYTLNYKTGLSGQFRSNQAIAHALDPNAPAMAGFSITGTGSWTLDLNHAEYLRPEYNDQTATITRSAQYLANGVSKTLTFTFQRTENGTLIATPVATDGSPVTFSRGDWIASAPEGRQNDRYFKFISKAVLEAYGATETDQVDDKDETIYSWQGVSNPLRELNGKEITTAGYYDFTRGTEASNGAEFIYETVEERGQQVDYIVGIKLFIKDNEFGDNDPAANKIRDPGAPVTILPELGVITTLTNTIQTSSFTISTYTDVNTVESEDSLSFRTSAPEFTIKDGTPFWLNAGGAGEATSPAQATAGEGDLNAMSIEGMGSIQQAPSAGSSSGS